MIDDPLVRDLLRPENLPGNPASVETISTHASFVFLTPADVYKVKRAKDYGFFDYSTVEKRRHFCEAEVRLNRRGAPGVYLAALPVYRDQRGFSLNRTGGEIADWAVHMRRLPDEQNALRLLDADRLEHEDLDRAARAVADFYAAAEEVPVPGGAAGALEHNIRENFEQVEPYVPRLVDARVFRESREAAERWLAANRDLLAARPSRDGHGDLRLEHVYLMPDRVLLVDCIEFLDRFRIADPGLDVAFLAMDLHHLGRADLAEYFLGRFALEGDDYGFYPLADGYLSYRAWVRGKVTAFLAEDPKADEALRARKAKEARAYFELAHHALTAARPEPWLIGIGGVIGAGKSSLALGLARRTGAAVVSADATRKFLAGLPHEAAGDDRLYREPFSSRTREAILARAGDVLRSKRTAILDTTFAAQDLRDRARELARSLGARFLFVECRAPAEVARRRLRERTGGVSDAREDLYPLLSKSFQPVVEIGPDEHHVADTTRPLNELVDEVARRLRP